MAAWSVDFATFREVTGQSVTAQCAHSALFPSRYETMLTRAVAAAEETTRCAFATGAEGSGATWTSRIIQGALRGLLVWL